jgi:CheY-like chemotaxis protein
MKIMVVDDEQDIQMLFQQKFRRELKAGQIELEFVFSGEAALAYLDSQGIAGLRILLSDINMPGMNGLELLKRIKEKYAQLKVYMITAYGDESNYRQALAYGCDDYMTKPLDFVRLKEKIFD